LSADYLTDRLGANLDGMLAEYAVLSEEAIVNVRQTMMNQVRARGLW
jgi:hypothetical protein